MITSAYSTLTGTVASVSAMITKTNRPLTLVKVNVCDSETVVRHVTVKAFDGRAVALATINVGEHIKFVGKIEAEGFVPADTFEPVALTVLHPSGWNVVPETVPDGIKTQLTGPVVRKTSAVVNESTVLETTIKVVDDRGRVEYVTVKAFNHEAVTTRGLRVGDLAYVEGEPFADAFVNREGKVVDVLTIKHPTQAKINYRNPNLI